MRHLRTSLLVFLTVLLLAAACGSGSAPKAPTATPAAGPAGGPQYTLDLATSAPDLTVFGAHAGDYLADRFSLACGDFNGDGKDDILVGAPLSDGPDNARPDAGETYVIFGRTGDEAKVDLATSQPDLTVVGANASDNLGFTVAAGDVNGDGIDDILVGARFATPAGGAASAGEVYVIFGSPSPRGTVDIGQGQQDVTIAGANAGDFLGYALTAGDVNGDGIADIITAASAASPDAARPNAGEAYVIFGSSGLSGRIDVAQGQQDFTILGAEAQDLLANYAATGDVNGDGITDILLGTHKADGPDNARPDAGEAYVIFGRSSLQGTLDLASGDGFVTIYGADAQDWLGFYLTAADVNGDGIADAIVGARNADGPDNRRNNCGEVYLIFGRKNLPKGIDIARGQQDVTIVGAGPNDLLGHALAAADIDGDGIADVVAGAPTAAALNNSRAEAGEVGIFAGRSAWPAVLDAASQHPGVVISGAEAGDELGFSVASGDFDGDGKADVMAGAPPGRRPRQRPPRRRRSVSDPEQEHRAGAVELYYPSLKLPDRALRIETCLPAGGSAPSAEAAGFIPQSSIRFRLRRRQA